MGNSPSQRLRETNESPEFVSREARVLKEFNSKKGSQLTKLQQKP